MTIVQAGVSGFDLLGLGEKCKKRAFSPEVIVWGVNLNLNPSGKRSHDLIWLISLYLTFKYKEHKKIGVIMKIKYKEDKSAFVPSCMVCTQ